MPDMGFPGGRCPGSLHSQSEVRSVDVALGILDNRASEPLGSESAHQSWGGIEEAVRTQQGNTGM